MGFLEKKKKQVQFQEQFKTDSTGVPKHTSTLEQKRTSAIRTYEEPVLPKLGKILFIAMFVLTAVMVAVDCKNGFLYINLFGLSRVLYNVSQTGLTIWLIFTVLISLVSGIGMRQNITAVRRKAQESACIEWNDEEAARCARSSHRLNKPYRLYLLCCLIGIVFWLLFYVSIRIIF